MLGPYQTYSTVHQAYRTSGLSNIRSIVHQAFIMPVVHRDNSKISLHQAYIGHTSGLHQAYIGPTSGLNGTYIIYIGPASGLHQAYIGPTSCLHKAYTSGLYRAPYQAFNTSGLHRRYVTMLKSYLFNL